MSQAGMRVLILGGTTEASAIARALAEDSAFAPVLSLAGRTRRPAAPPVPWRSGGFGGAAGLAAYLAAEGMLALIDATHPFAARITANAAAAAERAGVPRVAVLRPAWAPGPGDRWVMVADMQAAAAALGVAPRRVFLTVGQGDVAAFGGPHRYLVRSVERPDDAPPGAELIQARGPFGEAEELALMQAHGIDTLVTKNSGGAAVAAKLAAARTLGVQVVMVARPPPPPDPVVPDAAAALAWLRGLARA